MKKFFLFPLILLLTFSLCSCNLLCGCVDDDAFPKENFDVPTSNSLVVYELSNGDTLTMLYDEDELFYGEWKHGDEIKRVGEFRTHMIDSCLIHGGYSRYGFSLFLHEISGITVADVYYPYGPITFKYPDNDTRNEENAFASFDAGILNSTKLTLEESGEELTIESIKVEDSPFTFWDWNDPAWADFDNHSENTHFVANDIGLSYHAWRNMGELKINDVTLPIKLDFHEETMTISVYVMSNNGSVFIMYLVGHMDVEDENVFVIDNIQCATDFTYAESFSDIKNIELVKTEIADQTADKDLIVLELATQEIMNNSADYTHFTDESAQNCDWKVVFKANTTVKDFKFLAINEAETIKIEKVLYTAGELTPEKPFVASTYINDATANRGISFTDANGNTKYYSISVSGKDGSLSLSEFTLA